MATPPDRGIDELPYGSRTGKRDQPGVGVYEYGGFPIHFSDWGPAEMRPAPLLGGDNRQICEELGFSASEIDEFIADGTLVDAPPVGAGR